MDNAARMRQRVLAVFLPLAAVLYVSAEALDPKGTDKVIGTIADAFKVLPIAAMHPAQLYVSGSLSLLALGALAVSYAAIATLVRGRGATVATVAALVGGIGAFCGAMVNVLVGVNVAAAATAHMTRDAAAQFLADFLQLRVRARVLGPLLPRHLRRAGPDGVCPVAKPERAALAGGPVHRRPGDRPAGPVRRAGPGRLLHGCRSRWRWCCWGPGSGRPLPGPPATTWRRPARPRRCRNPGARRRRRMAGKWPSSDSGQAGFPRHGEAGRPGRASQPVNCEEDGGVSFWKQAENPRTRPPRSWAFDAGCAVVAGAASLAHFSFGQAAASRPPVAGRRRDRRGPDGRGAAAAPGVARPGLPVDPPGRGRRGAVAGPRRAVPGGAGPSACTPSPPRCAGPRR